MVIVDLAINNPEFAPLYFTRFFNIDVKNGKFSRNEIAPELLAATRFFKDTVLESLLIRIKNRFDPHLGCLKRFISAFVLNLSPIEFPADVQIFSTVGDVTKNADPKSLVPLRFNNCVSQ